MTNRAPCLFPAVPPPGVAISSEDTAHNGTNYTLTCAVTVEPAVDTGLQVTRTWRRGNAILSDPSEATIAQSNDRGVYTSSLTFEPLDSGDDEQYTCQAEVEPLPPSSFISGSNYSSEHFQLEVLGKQI